LSLGKSNKRDDVVLRVAEAVACDSVFLSAHANQRMAERNITRFDILYVLENGTREPRKDAFKATFDEWTYAYRGWTSEKRMELRIAVAVLDNGVLVVTAVDLTPG